ncbi:MAG: hypothetical protein GJ680_02520 [Alteromonadaceae bacterium]|nr:hypothetical protein [Alteromonadaceae bacterium]
MSVKSSNFNKAILAMAISLSLAACGGSDTNEPIPTPPVPPPTPTPDPVVAPETSDSLSFVVTGSVVDSFSGEIVNGVNLIFRENGQVSANIRDINGQSIDTIVTQDGTFAFTLSEDVTVDDLIITAEANNFIDKSVSFDLSDTSSDIAISIAMIANDANGVSVETVEEAISDSQVAEEVVATAGTEETSAEVVVPAGTQLQDSDGNPVSGTSVAIEVTVVDTTEDTSGDTDQASAADVLPAGLNTGITDTIEIPVGVANVEMVDDQGNEIERFSNPISITISLPNDGTVQAGNVYNLQSYDEDTGVWTDEESDVIVGALDVQSNRFPASFEIDHLTFFAVTTPATACANDIVANFSGSAVPTTGLFFKAFSTDASLDVYIPGGTTSATLLTAARAATYNIISTATARVQVRDVSDFSWYDSSTEVAVCGAIPVTLTQPNTLINENFSITATCSNDPNVVTNVDGAFVSYGYVDPNTMVTKTPIPAEEIGSGVYTLHDLVQGSAYDVIIDPRISDVNGTVAGQVVTITADGSDDAFDFSVQCSTGTGAG